MMFASSGYPSCSNFTLFLLLRIVFFESDNLNISVSNTLLKGLHFLNICLKHAYCKIYNLYIYYYKLPW